MGSKTGKHCKHNTVISLLKFKYFQLRMIAITAADDLSIPKKAIHKIQSMETEKTDFIYSERTNKRQRFDRRLVEHIVSLVEQGVPRRDLMEQYGVANNTLMNWMNKYGSGLTKRKSYTQAEKRTVVRALVSGMSTGEAQAAYNISCSSLILRWRKKLRKKIPKLA